MSAKVEVEIDSLAILVQQETFHHVVDVAHEVMLKLSREQLQHTVYEQQRREQPVDIEQNGRVADTEQLEQAEVVEQQGTVITVKHD